MRFRVAILCVLSFLWVVSGVVCALSLSSSGGGDWQYYKIITIRERSGNTLIDFQVPVILDVSNFGFSKANVDGSDIRFTDENGDELPYWIEEWDFGRYAKIWVRVPFIPANGEARIRMYYGNPAASGVSNGDATFEFFDDFEGASLNTSKWDVGGSGTGRFSVNKGVLTLYVMDRSYYDDAPALLISKSTLNSGTIKIRVKEKVSGGTSQGSCLFTLLTFDGTLRRLSSWAGDYRPCYDAGVKLDSNGKYYILWTDKDADAEQELSVASINKDKWNTVEFSLDLSKGALRSEEPHSTLTLTITDGLVERLKQPYIYLGIARSGAGSFDAFIDFILVRKYVDPEPEITVSHEYLVEKAPELKLSLKLAETKLKLGEASSAELSVENVGNAAAYDVQLAVTAATGLKVTDGEFSISSLEAGEGRKFELEIVAEDAGVFEVNARAVYRDAMGNEYSREVEEQIEVYKEAEEEKEGEEVPDFELLSLVAAMFAAILIRRLQRLSRR